MFLVFSVMIVNNFVGSYYRWVGLQSTACSPTKNGSDIRYWAQNGLRAYACACL